jgi:MFS family permease
VTVAPPAPAASDPHAPDGDAARRQLALLALAVLLGMAPWFATSVVAPELRGRLALTDARVAWLATAVQLGFVVGTAAIALSGLADRVAPRRLFAVAASASALATLVLLVDADYATVLASRAATGVALAGVYPPAMKMASTWFRRRRGLAIGVVVGALTMGKAVPWLLHALPAPPLAATGAVLVAGSVLAALLVGVGYRDGPLATPPRPVSLALVRELVALPRYRLVTLAYLGHMLELYAFWAWVPTLLAARNAARATPLPARTIDLLAFVVIAVGAPACLWGGRVADRSSRTRLVTIALAGSGACALATGVAAAAPLTVATLVAAAWGWFVIADSAQFSALVTESVPEALVGTALSLQTSLGFASTMLTIPLVPLLAPSLGWPVAMAILAIGPAIGLAAIRRVRAAA